MNIKIDNLPNYRIAYVRQVGPYGPHNVKVMEQLKNWAKRKELLNKESIILSIPRDNPEVTSPNNCRYDACIVISDGYQLDNDVSEDKLLGGQYAIYKVKHTAEEIQKAWATIFPDLLKKGYQVDAKPIFERYSGEATDINYCDICVPIKLKE
ncbi:AraC family transcriptional regulator [Priestia megaterium]|uniref:AraC family transcriptional regulator n=1 Tax=Priestia megaterium TaxID=1404 RepID=UPI0023DB02D9|nr:GyrI-like domain-containing protein [Priestia megaterium]MDF2014991.1 GyrI-like domain-containing protein [Priestia megaterium]